MLLALWPAIQSVDTDSLTEVGSYYIGGYSTSSFIEHSSSTIAGSYVITGYECISEVKASVKHHGSSSRKRREAIMRDDEEIMLCISRIMCIASNN